MIKRQPAYSGPSVDALRRCLNPSAELALFKILCIHLATLVAHVAITKKHTLQLRNLYQ